MLFMDERKRCQHHKSNYINLKRQYTRLQQAMNDGAADVSKMLIERDKAQAEKRQIFEELTAKLTAKTIEANELRDNVLSVHDLEVLKAKIQKEVEDSFKETLTKREEEIVHCRDELNKLRDENCLLNTKFNLQQQLNARRQEKIQLKHDSELTHLRMKCKQKCQRAEQNNMQCVDALKNENFLLNQRLTSLQEELTDERITVEREQRKSAHQLKDTQAKLNTAELRVQKIRECVEQMENVERNFEEQKLQLLTKLRHAEQEIRVQHEVAQTRIQLEQANQIAALRMEPSLQQQKYANLEKQHMASKKDLLKCVHSIQQQDAACNTELQHDMLKQKKDIVQGQFEEWRTEECFKKEERVSFDKWQEKDNKDVMQQYLAKQQYLEQNITLINDKIEQMGDVPGQFEELRRELFQQREERSSFEKRMEKDNKDATQQCRAQQQFVALQDKEFDQKIGKFEVELKKLQSELCIQKEEHVSFEKRHEKDNKDLMQQHFSQQRYLEQNVTLINDKIDQMGNVPGQFEELRRELFSQREEYASFEKRHEKDNKDLMQQQLSQQQYLEHHMVLINDKLDQMGKVPGQFEELRRELFSHREEYASFGKRLEKYNKEAMQQYLSQQQHLEHNMVLMNDKIDQMGKIPIPFEELQRELFSEREECTSFEKRPVAANKDSLQQEYSAQRQDIPICTEMTTNNIEVEKRVKLQTIEDAKLQREKKDREVAALAEFFCMEEEFIASQETAKKFQQEVQVLQNELQARKAEHQTCDKTEVERRKMNLEVIQEDLQKHAVSEHQPCQENWQLQDDVRHVCMVSEGVETQAERETQVRQSQCEAKQQRFLEMVSQVNSELTKMRNQVHNVSKDEKEIEYQARERKNQMVRKFEMLRTQKEKLELEIIILKHDVPREVHEQLLRILRGLASRHAKFEKILLGSVVPGQQTSPKL
uniref:Uncharacterized protein n=1 Tax=Eptatretus burgeri TaxID=7764 RepID=A0A8C4WWT7_EPTBU